MAANTKKIILFIVEEPNDEDAFADAYSDSAEAFISFLSGSDFTVQGAFGETWQFIFEGTNSLHRHSNLHLLFSDT